MNIFVRRISLLLLFLAFYRLHGVDVCRADNQTKAFTLQVMYGTERKVSYKFMKKLIEKGYPAYVHENPGEDGQTYYRVRIGRFMSDQEAQPYVRALQEDNIEYWVAPARVKPGRLSAPQQGSTTQDSIPAEAVVLQYTDASTGAGNETEQTVSSADSGNEDSSKPGLTGSDAARSEVYAGDLQTAEKDASTEDQGTGTDTEAVTAGETDREDVAWPQTVSKIYKYYDSNGTLQVTNSFKNIPQHYQGAIREVIMFPVRFSSCNEATLLLQVEADDQTKNIMLADIKHPGEIPPAQAIAELHSVLREVPLRLTYDPSVIGSDGVIHGRLYYRTGTSVGLEMIKKGIALGNPDGLLPFKRTLYMDAENQAKKEKRGVWALQNVIGD